jgi:hypothetical protein
MKKDTMLVGMIASILVGLPVFLILRHQSVKSGFAQIHVGASLVEVEKTLGRPYDAVECGHLGGDPPPGCMRELIYISPLMFWDAWTVAFDNSDRVIRKLRYRSP